MNKYIEVEIDEELILTWLSWLYSWVEESVLTQERYHSSLINNCVSKSKQGILLHWQNVVSKMEKCCTWVTKMPSWLQLWKHQQKHRNKERRNKKKKMMLRWLIHLVKVQHQTNQNLERANLKLKFHITQKIRINSKKKRRRNLKNKRHNRNQLGNRNVIVKDQIRNVPSVSIENKKSPWSKIVNTSPLIASSLPCSRNVPKVMQKDRNVQMIWHFSLFNIIELKIRKCLWTKGLVTRRPINFQKSLLGCHFVVPDK